MLCNIFVRYYSEPTEATEYWVSTQLPKSKFFCNRHKSLLSKVPDIGGAWAHPAHLPPPALTTPTHKVDILITVDVI